jgi:hypothetical protein
MCACTELKTGTSSHCAEARRLVDSNNRDDGIALSTNAIAVQERVMWERPLCGCVDAVVQADYNS